MPSYVTPLPGDDALAEHVAQLTENAQGLRNIPQSFTGINDPAAFAMTLKNAGTGAKGLIIYAADGTTVLLQVDSAGVKGSPDGVTPAVGLVTLTGTQTLANKTLTSPVIDTPTINGALAGTTFGAWTTFTPTANQGAALTVTVTYASYIVLGKLAIVQMRLGFTSAGTPTAALAVTGLPAAIAPKQVNNQAACGSGAFLDLSPQTFYVFSVQALSATTLQFFSNAGTGFFGTNPAITIASGDILTLQLAYEIA